MSIYHAVSLKRPSAHTFRDLIISQALIYETSDYLRLYILVHMGYFMTPLTLGRVQDPCLFNSWDLHVVLQDVFICGTICEKGPYCRVH